MIQYLSAPPEGCANEFITPGWYFWDESQSGIYGPYPSKRRAKLELNMYCVSVLGGYAGDMETRFVTAICQARQYVANVKKRVPAAHLTGYNTSVYRVAWRVYLGRGKMTLKNNNIARLSFLRYTWWYIKYVV